MFQTPTKIALIVNASALLKNTIQPSPSPMAEGRHGHDLGTSLSSTVISVPANTPITAAYLAAPTRQSNHNGGGLTQIKQPPLNPGRFRFEQVMRKLRNGNSSVVSG